MQARRIALVAVAVVVAGGTFVVARSLSTPAAPMAVQADAPAAVQPVVTRVLVAAEDLPSGLLVQPEHLRWQVWPADAIDDRFLVEGVRTAEDLTGAVVRTGLAAGEPVFETRVVKPGDRGFMAAVLNPDMRAVTVPINAVTGIAGFIFPGDRVDVILTHAVVRSQDPSRPERRASETVLTDVRVLALDQRVGDQQKDTPTMASTATLEIKPEQAEWLPLLVELGQLSLSLRSLARSDAEVAQAGTGPDGKGKPARVERPTHTWDSDVSALLPDPGSISKVNVLRGEKGDVVTFGTVK